MELIIWLLTFIPCTVLLLAAGGVDLYLLSILDERGILADTMLSNTNFLYAAAIIVSIVAIICGVIGWRVGLKYVEMGRSRRWHYRATKYDDYSDQLHNAVHWAGKFACLPFILALILLMAYEIYFIV